MAELRVLSVNVRGLHDKLAPLQQLIYTHKPDFILLQETNLKDTYKSKAFIHNLGLADGIFSLGGFCRGTAILHTSDRWAIIDRSADNTSGRVTTATITRGDSTHTLVNIYAPALAHKRATFYTELAQTLTSFQHNIILAGDFNITLHDQDITGTDIGHTRPGRIELQHIINTHNLTDSYRKLHPNTIETTHKNCSYDRSARLDRIYTHSTNTITDSKHLDSTLKFTDHRAIITTLNANNNKQKGRSPHWKLNNSLLDDPHYITCIKNTIEIHSNPLPTHNIRNTWESLKQAIKTVTIIIATQKNKQRHIEEKKLEKEITKAKETGKQKDTHTLELQEQLDDLRQHKYKGALIRTRYKLIEEKPTPQYLGIEQSVQKNRQIEQITDTQGNTQTDAQKIADAFQQFYTELYTAEHTDDSVQDSYMPYTRQLTDQQKQTLDTNLTTDDFSEAVRSMQINSSPGSDGITSEFYKLFFKDLSPLFLAMTKEIFEEEALTDSQNLSYITLIPKESDDPTNMKHFRPISLLNVDYKIITKALTTKLSTVMPHLIHPDQTCSVKGRNIQQSNHFIRDVISLAHDKQLDNSILSLDQTKAFDRVSHSFLHKVLKQMNFGPYFRKWIQIIYKQPTSQILVNHILSGVIQLSRSVRQGDPLSPLAYILTLEPLLNKIRSDKEIKGIHIPGEGVRKIVAYADDTSFFPGDDNSIRKILDTFRHFGRGSGSQINESKSQILAIGKWQNKANNPFRLQQVTEIKIFGIYYSKSRNQSNIKSWKKLVTDIETLLNKFYYKPTTIFGRSIIVNTLVHPKILYLTQTLDPPRTIVKQINMHLRRFLFKGSARGIRHTTLIQTKLHGGINLHCIQSKTSAFRLKYIYDIIKNKQQYPLSHYYIGLSLIKYTQLDNKQPHFFGTLPTFYSNIRDILRQHGTLLKTSNTTKHFYKEIIQKQATPLYEQIKRGLKYTITDFTDSFQNLHIKQTTAVQKQIMYRLLFQNTPTTNALQRRYDQIRKCSICRKNIAETEEHIFFNCSHIQQIKQTLTIFLKTQNTEQVDTYRAIFLNTLTDKQQDTLLVKLHLLALYRDTIWHVRLKSKFSDAHHTPNTIHNMFIAKTTHALQTKQQWPCFERMLSE